MNWNKVFLKKEKNMCFFMYFIWYKLLKSGKHIKYISQPVADNTIHILQEYLFKWRFTFHVNCLWLILIWLLLIRMAKLFLKLHWAENRCECLCQTFVRHLLKRSLFDCVMELQQKYCAYVMWAEQQQLSLAKLNAGNCFYPQMLYKAYWNLKINIWLRTTIKCILNLIMEST